MRRVARPRGGRWKRVKASFTTHIRLWAATVAAIVALGSYMVSSTLWIKAQIESFHTDVEAHEQYAKLRKEAADEYIKLRAEMKALNDAVAMDLKGLIASLERKGLWLNAGQIRIEALVIRNRVNDCNDKKSQSSSCEQYRDELKEVQERYNEARKNALQAK